MISEKLKQDALDFLSAVKADYEAKVSAAYQDGYNKHKAEVEASQEVAPSAPEPVVPEPQPTDDPIDDPANEGYSRDKVIAELLAIKGSRSYAFGIIDTLGNVHATASEWILNGRPQVIGIGYTDGAHHLCMHPKKVGRAAFGGNGVNFGPKVHTTRRQWHKDATPTENAAWDDYSGESNTEGIKAACSDSIASKCNDYMPACAELRVYCKYFKEVDALLKAVDGDVLKVQNGAYLLWSSTCRDASNAWCVRYMNEGDAQPAYHPKTSVLFTRQFITL